MESKSTAKQQPAHVYDFDDAQSLYPGDGNIPDQSEIDDDELQKQLEEEMERLNNDPDNNNDDFEKSSTYSMFGQSMQGFNLSGNKTNGGSNKLTEDNMDDYIEHLLQKERDKNKFADKNFFENNTVLNNLREMDEQQINAIMDNNDLEDLKQLNQVDLNQYAQQTLPIEMVKSSSSPVKQERSGIVKIELAEEKIMREMKEEKERKEQDRRKKLDDRKKIMDTKETVNRVIANDSSMSKGDEIDFNQYISQPGSRLEQPKERVEVATKGVRQIMSYETDMERATMSREDKMSRDYEEFIHRQKFKQKDKIPPPLPIYFTDDQHKQVLKNKPVQRNPVPSAPTTENFLRYRIGLNVSLPMKIDFSKVKVLWSKEKQDAEEEQRRLDELRRQKELEHQRLLNLAKFCRDKAKQQMQGQADFSQIKKALEILEKVDCSTENNQPISIQAVPQKQVQKIEINIAVCKNIGQQALYESQSQIYSKYMTQVHKDHAQKHSALVTSLSKLIPNRKECEDQRPKPPIKQKNKNNNEFKLPSIGGGNGAESELAQALELHAPEPRKTDKIEIKSEEWPQLDLTALNSYKNLINLNLSMNKIALIKGGIDCPLLQHLRLSDNVIKEIPPSLLQKCSNLKTLNFDINQIRKLQNLDQLYSLEDLSLSNNQIQQIEGLQGLTKLRRLNLSFNKLTKIEGLQNLQMLEYLELGKNFISNMDHLANNPSNRFCFLTDLYLYSNQLMNIPHNLSYMQLKVLNLNRNQDLSLFSLGYCPLLEQLSLSYCSFIQLKSLVGAPNLKDLDLSFNSIQNLEHMLALLRWNKELRLIRFNDNTFSVNKDQHFDSYLKIMFPMLERVNGNQVVALKNKIDGWEAMKNLGNRIWQVGMLRGLIGKMMSSKVRANFYATTDIMKYTKNILPLTIMQSLTSLDALESYLYTDRNPLLVLLKSNFEYVLRLKRSVRIILSFYRRRKIVRAALLKRMQDHKPKIILIQALVRGHLTRVRNAAVIKRIKSEAPKKTKKYQQVAKIQALVRGFLFRQRRKKALERLKPTSKQEDDSLLGDDFEEFDADKFFDIKQENFESGLSVPQQEMMQQMFQMMSMNKPQQAMRQPAKQQQIQVLDSSVKLPPIKQNQTSSNMSDMIKPKSMVGQQPQTMTKTNDNQFYKRPPSSKSSALSEIEMNHDGGTFNKSGYPGAVTGAQLMARRNNLMNDHEDLSATQQRRPHRVPSISGGNSNLSQQHLDDELRSQYSMHSNPFYPQGSSGNSYVQKVAEDRKNEHEAREQKIAEWGFANEETKKIFEARMLKQAAMKTKKKKLTAAEKYEKLMANKEYSRK